MNAHAAGEGGAEQTAERASLWQAMPKQTRTHARARALTPTAASVRWHRRIGRCWTRTRLGSTGWSSRRHAPILFYAHFLAAISRFLCPYFRKPPRRGESAMRATARGDAAGATKLRLAGAARLWLGGRQGADAAAADSARQAVQAPTSAHTGGMDAAAHLTFHTSHTLARVRSSLARLQRLWYARAGLQRAAKSPFEGRARPLLALGPCTGSRDRPLQGRRWRHPPIGPNGTGPPCIRAR
jgi:hypothetical protein